VPATVSDYREKLLHLRKLRHDVVQGAVPQGRLQEVMALSPPLPSPPFPSPPLPSPPLSSPFFFSLLLFILSYFSDSEEVTIYKLNRDPLSGVIS
jgi:hypothetical protein